MRGVVAGLLYTKVSYPLYASISSLEAQSLTHTHTHTHNHLPTQGGVQQGGLTFDGYNTGVDNGMEISRGGSMWQSSPHRSRRIGHMRMNSHARRKTIGRCCTRQGFCPWGCLACTRQLVARRRVALANVSGPRSHGCWNSQTLR